MGSVALACQPGLGIIRQLDRDGHFRLRDKAHEFLDVAVPPLTRPASKEAVVRGAGLDRDVER